MKGPSPPNLPARPVVNELLTLPLAQRLKRFPTGGYTGLCLGAPCSAIQTQFVGLIVVAALHREGAESP